jgi:CDP-6-deoxy-D-xylo-4-hexulose-3-dehydrase
VGAGTFFSHHMEGGFVVTDEEFYLMDDWFVLPGYNVEMSGAIGIEQLKKLPNFLATRRENAQLFVESFKKIFVIVHGSLIIKPT